MSEKSRHKSVPTQEKRVSGIGMSERKLATNSRVADMSPTCRRHFQPSCAARNLADGVDLVLRHLHRAKNLLKLAALIGRAQVMDHRMLGIISAEARGGYPSRRLVHCRHSWGSVQSLQRVASHSSCAGNI
jgi:hypothetical protein